MIKMPLLNQLNYPIGKTFPGMPCLEGTSSSLLLASLGIQFHETEEFAAQITMTEANNRKIMLKKPIKRLSQNSKGRKNIFTLTNHKMYIAEYKACAW